MSEVIEINSHFRLLAMDMYGELPYHQKTSDYIEEKFGTKSLNFKEKLLAAFEDLFIDLKKGKS